MCDFLSIMKRIIYIICFCSVLIGCSKRTGSGLSMSSEARVTAMSFVAQDSFPGFAAARFAIEEKIDTGLIYNKDSIMYGTPLNRAIPKFTFAATPKEGYLYVGNKVYAVTNKDTVDMTESPIYLTIVSQNGENTKTYEIQLTQHQVDPDQMTWTCLNDGMCSAITEDQTMVMLNDRLYVYYGDETSLTAYASEDGVEWLQINVNGLPESPKARHIIADEAALYYGDSTAIYTSEDGSEWTVAAEMPEGVKVHRLLFNLGYAIWFIAEQEGQLYLGHYDALEGLSESLIALPDNTPVRDFGTCVFPAASERERAMIIGGYTKDGSLSSRRTQFEYSPSIAADGHVRIIDYTDQEVMDTLSGVAVVGYGKKIYRFGGTDMQGQYFPSPVYTSIDEGYHWSVPDSAHHIMPEALTDRKGQTVIMHNNGLYLFGGYNEQGAYSDMYYGRLTRADWEEE